MIQFGLIWPKFGPTKLILVTLRDSYKCVGVTFGGYLAKILSFKSANLLYKSNFYLLSEAIVQYFLLIELKPGQLLDVLFIICLID